MGSSRRAVGAAIVALVLVVGLIGLVVAQRDSRTKTDSAAAWTEGAVAGLAGVLVPSPPPRLVQPPLQVDLYQSAQTVGALAEFGELTDADRETFQSLVAANLERELRDGYTGPRALAAQLVRVSTEAGVDLTDPGVFDLIAATVDGPSTDDIYDQLASLEVSSWVASRNGTPPSAPTLSRAASRTIRCRGDEALFVQAAILRAGVSDTGCSERDKSILVETTLPKLRALSAADKPLPSDAALRLRAVSMLVSTPAQEEQVAAIRSDYVARLDVLEVSDPLVVAYALGEVAGDAELSSGIVELLRQILADGGAPSIEKLSPTSAATVARTLEIGGVQVPDGLLADSADLPVEVRARVALASGASGTEANAVLSEGALPEVGRRGELTGVFQLLLRQGAPLCSRWMPTARATVQDVDSAPLDRVLAARYLRECGEADVSIDKTPDEARAADDSEIREAFNRQSLACARDEKLRTPQEEWSDLRGYVEPGQPVEDEAGAVDVTQTFMLVALLDESRDLCRDGVYW